MNLDLLIEGFRDDEYVGDMKVSHRLTSSVALASSGESYVILDTGGLGYAPLLLRRLSEAGVKPGQVDTIVNTHYHLDHIYNNYLFPYAKTVAGSSVWYPEDGNRVEMIPDIRDAPLPEGLEIISTPGHMDKHISVLIRQEDKTVCFAGDAVRESTILEGFVPKNYTDPIGYLKSMKEVFELSDEIIPGHGEVIDAERMRTLKPLLDDIDIR